MNSQVFEDIPPDYVWEIVPARPPLVHRNCAKCEKTRRFYCSGKFRVNAQQKNVDVWLIYKCTACDATWNCSVLRQVSPRSIDPDLYNKFQINDQGTCWDYAFNHELLKRNGVVPDPSVDYTVEGQSINLADLSTEKLSILIKFRHRFDLRLETLLSHRLLLSRKQLELLFENGSLEVSPAVRNLRRKLKGDVLVVLSVNDVARSLGRPAPVSPHL